VTGEVRSDSSELRLPEERTGRSRIVATIRGAVQGVGFRWFVQREASALDLEGWVANRADGSVEVVAEGPADAIDRLVDRLHEGPPAALVRVVEVRSEPVRGLSGGFGVRSGDHRGD
jgi:acylphosphatase